MLHLPPRSYGVSEPHGGPVPVAQISSGFLSTFIASLAPSQTSNAIEHHAEYILRKGAKDLGSHTLEGSRPGMAMLVHACLKVIGRKGYEMLIDKSLEKARYFAELIKQTEDFELVTEPELCLLTYRCVPEKIKDIRILPDIIITI